LLVCSHNPALEIKSGVFHLLLSRSSGRQPALIKPVSTYRKQMIELTFDATEI
jgi:hypothetical protein